MANMMIAPMWRKAGTSADKTFAPSDVNALPESVHRLGQ